MRLIMLYLVALLMVGASPVAAQSAQSRILPVSAEAPFAHQDSGVSLPATLLGLRRFEVRELEAPQLDIWARYRNDDASELTVYVYRVTSGAVPVWFDRAVWAVENRGGNFGSATAVAPPRAIAVPGSATTSGLIQSWSLSGGAYTGTGLLIAPLGEWLVKLRYSTTSGDGSAAETRVREAFAALGWPAVIPAARGATAIGDCPSQLAFKGSAKSISADGASSLLGALLGGIAKSAVKVEGPPPTWCRDTAKIPTGGVYRADAAQDSYLLALSDAGRGAVVTPDAARALMERRDGTKAWSIALVLPGRTINYPSQNRLPSPERVLAVIEGPAVSSASTWDKDAQINLSPTR